MEKKIYETCEIEIVNFTEEDVMGASGFIGKGDDLTKNMLTGDELNGWRV